MVCSYSTRTVVRLSLTQYNIVAEICCSPCRHSDHHSRPSFRDILIGLIKMEKLPELSDYGGYYNSTALPLPTLEGSSPDSGTERPRNGEYEGDQVDTDSDEDTHDDMQDPTDDIYEHIQ